MIKTLLWGVVAVVLLPGYQANSSARAQSAADLVDPSIKQAVGGQKGWSYTRQASADLDGDGTHERVFLIANVETRRGKPVWDDAQIWQVYIEEANANRTYIFSRWVQLGRVEAIVTEVGADRRAGIILVERTAHSFAVYELRYRGPSNVQVVELIKRPVNPRYGFVGTVE